MEKATYRLENTAEIFLDFGKLVHLVTGDLIKNEK